MHTISTYGYIDFYPVHKTGKHREQGTWKHTAIITLDNSDICAYYRWFIKKEHGLPLAPIIRGPHITFINDRLSDITNLESITLKYNGLRIPIILDLDARTDGKTWWLNIPQDKRAFLHIIREELGLGRPYAGLHMSIGRVPDNNSEHGQYIHRLYLK